MKNTLNHRPLSWQNLFRKSLSVFLSYLLILNSTSLSYAMDKVPNDILRSSSKIEYNSLSAGTKSHINYQHTYYDQGKSKQDAYVESRVNELSSNLQSDKIDHHIEVKTGYACSAAACVTISYTIDGITLIHREKIYAQFKDGIPGPLGLSSGGGDFSNGKIKTIHSGASQDSAYQLALAQLHLKNSELSQKNQILSSKQQALNSKINELKNENSGLNAKNEELSKANASLSTARSDLEKSENELAHEIQRLNEASKAMHEAGKSAEREKQKASNSEQEFQRLVNEKEKLKNHRLTLEERLQSLESQLKDSLDLADKKLKEFSKLSETHLSNSKHTEKLIKDAVSNHNDELADIDQLARTNEGLSRLNMDFDKLCEINISPLELDLEALEDKRFSSSNENQQLRLKFSKRYMDGVREHYRNASDSDNNFKDYYEFAKASLEAADRAFSEGKISIGEKLVERTLSLINESFSEDSYPELGKDFVSQEDFSKNALEILQKLRERREDVLEQIEFMDHYEERRELVDTASKALDASQEFYNEDDIESSWSAAKIATVALDFATSFTPGVSVGRDLYEAVEGKDLISGEFLDSFDRTFAVIGVVTAGLGSKIGKSIKCLGKLMKGERATDALKACEKLLPSRSSAFKQAKRDLGIPNNQQPDIVKRVELTDKARDRQGVYTREYHFTKEDGSRVVIQEHSHGHQFGQGGVGDQGPHFNVRKFNPDDGNGMRTGKVPGTKEHYSY